MSEGSPWDRADRISDRVEPPTFPDQAFPVTDYGAVGDGQTDCTNSIERAISACSDAGGGQVVIPKGTFRTGAIHLEDNVNLHVTDSATIAFSRDPDDYLPAVHTRWEGTELYNYSPFIYAFECENIAITGPGTLDGRANFDNWWPWCGWDRYGWEPGGPNQHEDQSALEEMAAEGVPVSEREFGDSHFLRPNFIQPYRCENVLIADVTVKNSPMWVIHPVLSKNITVRDVTVDSHGPNSDGCNPESCTDVVIRGCTFDAGDDCIAIKSGREADGRRLNTPTENVLIEGCEFISLYGAVTIGSEMTGGVRNVFVRNCSGGSSELYYVLYIKTNASRGGFAENIHLKDIHISNVTEEVLSCDFYRGEGDEGGHTPVVQNVDLRGVTVENARGLFLVRGFDRSPVRELRLQDCNFENVNELAAVENADIDFEDVVVNAVDCTDVADVREVLAANRE